MNHKLAPSRGVLFGLLIVLPIWAGVFWKLAHAPTSVAVTATPLAAPLEPTGFAPIYVQTRELPADWLVPSAPAPTVRLSDEDIARIAKAVVEALPKPAITIGGHWSPEQVHAVASGQWHPVVDAAGSPITGPRHDTPGPEDYCAR